MFVKPDIVAALFQVGVDAADEFFVGVVSVAEEDAEGEEWRFMSEFMTAIFADTHGAFLAEYDVLRGALGTM